MKVEAWRLNKISYKFNLFLCCMWLIYNNGHPNYIFYDWFKIYLHLNCRFQQDIQLTELKDLDMHYQQDTNCIKIFLEESNNQVGMVLGVESH